jgi:hypothetical protein
VNGRNQKAKRIKGVALDRTGAGRAHPASLTVVNR